MLAASEQNQRGDGLWLRTQQVQRQVAPARDCRVLHWPAWWVGRKSRESDRGLGVRGQRVVGIDVSLARLQADPEVGDAVTAQEGHERAWPAGADYRLPGPWLPLTRPVDKDATPLDGSARIDGLVGYNHTDREVPGCFLLDPAAGMRIRAGKDLGLPADT
jgi:hypothetical protein